MADGDIRVSARAASGGCAFCKDAIPAANLHACAGCGATYHAECFERELTRCATLGCASPGVRPAPAPGDLLRDAPAEGASERARAARPRSGEAAREPRDGDRRTCAGCLRPFAVRAEARYSPTCLPCTHRRQAEHLLLFALFLVVLFGGLAGLVSRIPSNVHDTVLDHGQPPRRR